MNQRDADRLAKKLVAEHVPGWRVTWGHGKSQFGVCQYGPQDSTGKYLTRTIRLSRPLTLLNTQATFEWVVKHEIAHALNGHEAPSHGRLFMRQCRALGIEGDRCWTKGGNSDVVRIEGKILGTCKNRCGYISTMHKMTHASYTRGICPTCSNRARRQYVHLDWTRDGQPVAKPKKPAPRRRTRRYSR